MPKILIEDSGINRSIQDPREQATARRGLRSPTDKFGLLEARPSVVAATISRLIPPLQLPLCGDRAEAPDCRATLLAFYGETLRGNVEPKDRTVTLTLDGPNEVVIETVKLRKVRPTLWAFEFHGTGKDRLLGTAFRETLSLEAHGIEIIPPPNADRKPIPGDVEVAGAEETEAKDH
jgi:hypothetical protein